MSSQRNIRVAGRDQSGVAEGDVVTVSVVPTDQRDVKGGLEGRFVKARERLPCVGRLHLCGGQIPGEGGQEGTGFIPVVFFFFFFFFLASGQRSCQASV